MENPPQDRCADNALPDIGGSLLSCLTNRAVFVKRSLSLFFATVLSSPAVHSDRLRPWSQRGSHSRGGVHALLRVRHEGRRMLSCVSATRQSKHSQRSHSVAGWSRQELWGCS
jgi:hypothetical protein